LTDKTQNNKVKELQTATLPTTQHTRAGGTSEQLGVEARVEKGQGPAVNASDFGSGGLARACEEDKFNQSALGQAPKSFHLYLALMDETVFSSVVHFNEAVSALDVEALDAASQNHAIKSSFVDLLIAPGSTTSCASRLVLAVESRA